MILQEVPTAWTGLGWHLVSKTEFHKGSSIENGITVGFLVGDVQSAVDELKLKGCKFTETSSKRILEKTP